MSTIITRSDKGSPLSHAEMDANFTNLNTDKTNNASAAITGGAIDGTTIGGTTPAAGAFTTLSATTPLPLTSGGTGKGTAPAAQSNLLGYTTTATAAGTTTLDNTSSFYQLFTGATTQTVVLPVTSTLALGWSFRINNSSSGALTIQSSGLNAVVTVNGNTTVYLTCINTGVTDATGWRVGFTEVAAVTGSGSMVLNSGASLVNLTATGSISLTGTSTNNSTFHTSQAAGTITVGGTTGTGLIIFGRSTVSQTTSIQDGVTASGSTKTITIGTAGALGSTTSITFGSATSGATSNTNVNGTLKVGINLANYVQVVGAATTFSPVLSSQGSDGNIDLTLTPKGTGRVNITTSIKPKVNSAANVVSPLAWDSTSYDEYAITALANALTINADANTSPADGQKMMFRFKDNGTARALTWTTGSTNSFRVVGVTLPTTTVASKLVYIGCIYNAADSRWDAVAVSQEA
jgi:hypothetical protein